MQTVINGRNQAMRELLAIPEEFECVGHTLDNTFSWRKCGEPAKRVKLIGKLCEVDAYLCPICIETFKADGYKVKEAANGN